MHKYSNFPAPYCFLGTAFILFFHNSYPSGYEVVSYMVLICISLVIGDLEYLSTFLKCFLLVQNNSICEAWIIYTSP